jgi:hypothetical protein
LLAGAAWFAPFQDAPFTASGQHIRLSAHCDPPIVRPGGWLDVVIEGRTDPGWHITSPASKRGQRASVELELPAGFVRFGRLHAPPGRELHDEIFGAVEILEDRFELRQHVRVPEELATKELTIRGTSVWIVCDPTRCLPPQKLELDVPLTIDSQGARGPNPSIGEPALHAGTEERALLASEGFFARAIPEVERVTPGDEILVALDIALDPKQFEQVSRVWLEPSPEFLAKGEAWRARESTVEIETGKACRALRFVLPLQVAAGSTVPRSTFGSTWRLAADPGAGGSDVDREVGLTLHIDR